MVDLAGQIAVISGGLGDIGRSTALALADCGADIAVCDIHDADAATELLAAIDKRGRRSRYDRVDISDFSAVEAWIKTVEEQLGVATLIIPNAAIVHFPGFIAMQPADWDKEMAVNLNGVFYLCKAATARLLANDTPGRVVIMGSWAAAVPHPRIPAYSASKAGVRMLAKCMAIELAPHGILVNEVAPGYVNAGLSKRHWQNDPDAAAEAAAKIPTGQLIEPEEVARAVVHLCDPQNRHMTGSVILMDGGLSLRSSASSPVDPDGSN